MSRPTFTLPGLLVIEPTVRATRVRYSVLAALCLVTVINYIQRNSFGGLETTIRQNLNLEKSDTGLAIAAFFWVYALMQIPTGKLAQYWGPRRALALYTAGWSVAAAALALSTGVVDLVAYRSVMGALQAGIFPCATLIMVAWLPATQRAFASALLNSFMLLGGAAVNNFTGVLLAPLGWRGVMLVYAVPGLIFAAWFYGWFRNRPSEHPAVNDRERALIGEGPPSSGSVPRGRSALFAAVFSLPLLLLCTQQFCRAGANRFTDQWLSTYLQEEPLAHVADDAERKSMANHLTSLPQYAGVAGGLLGGLISDWLLRRTGRRRIARNGVAVVSLAATIVVYLPVFLVASAPEQMAFFSIGAFVSAFAAPCAYALSMDIAGKDLPLVFGAMNMVGNFGAAAMSQVVPLVNTYGGGWQASLIVFVAVHAVALGCWLLLDPNRPVGESPGAALKEKRREIH